MVKSSRIRETGRVECVRKKKSAYNLWVWKPEGRVFCTLRRRLENTYIVDHKEIEWEDVDWIHVALDSET
jgi:hypothetical protein